MSLDGITGSFMTAMTLCGALGSAWRISGTGALSAIVKIFLSSSKGLCCGLWGFSLGARAENTLRRPHFQACSATGHVENFISSAVRNN